MRNYVVSKLLPSGLALVCSPITCLNYAGILSRVLNQGERKMVKVAIKTSVQFSCKCLLLFVYTCHKCNWFQFMTLYGSIISFTAVIMDFLQMPVL